jgi:hypothetical protein
VGFNVPERGPARTDISATATGPAIEKAAQCTALFKEDLILLEIAPEPGQTRKAHFSNEYDRFQLWISSFEVSTGGLDHLGPDDSDLLNEILESLKSYLARCAYYDLSGSHHAVILQST